MIHLLLVGMLAWFGNCSQPAPQQTQKTPPAPVAMKAAAAPAVKLYTLYSGQKAYDYTKQVVDFGERWPGSPGHQKTEDLIHQVLTRDHAQIEADNFTAHTPTPRGDVQVHNIIGKFNVNPGDAHQPIFILAGHYDTLFAPKGFVGANDGGSSTAILLGFADALANPQAPKMKMQIWLMWTDLEEAIVSFTDNGDDGLYGSRHYAQKLKAEGLVPRIKGFFLLDMIGDKDLGVTKENGNSTAWLQDFIASAAKQLGYSQYFFHDEMNIIDDHVSFANVGIPSVDVVDANFGPMGPQYDSMGEYHHTLQDTMDKVSEKSLEIVGKTILLTVENLDAQT